MPAFSLDVRATVVDGTSGTTWNSTANAVDGAFGTNNATYCNWTNTQANAVGFIKLSTPATLPADATIENITVTVRHYESNATRIVSVRFQPYIGDVPIADTSGVDAVVATSPHDDTAQFVITAAQFADPNFNIRVTATRFSGTQAGIFYLDHVDITVNYTTPDYSGAWDGSSWETPEVWNGSRWVVPEVWNGSRWVTLGGL